MRRILPTLGLVAVMIALVGAGWAAARGTAVPLAAPDRVVTGTAFSYQGHLKDAGGPVTDTCDFEFDLFDEATGGIQIGTTVRASVVTVTDGLFTRQLDFGEVFNGTERHLEISVRCPAESGAYSTLSPRQEMTPVPYALALPGLYTQYNGTSSNIIAGSHENIVSDGVGGGTISGGGAPNWVTDDYGTVGGGKGNRAGDEFGTADSPYATVAGGEKNRAHAKWATVGGGYRHLTLGTASTIAGGYGNIARGNYSTVGGGHSNDADFVYSTIGGGQQNRTRANYTTVGGGLGNAADGAGSTIGGGLSQWATGARATIGGGEFIDATGDHSTVGGGKSNKADGLMSTVAGGQSNLATSDYAAVGGGSANDAASRFATIGGGEYNTANDEYAAVGGGVRNSSRGHASTVGGGEYNVADDDYASVGGGLRNTANSQGSTISGGSDNTATGEFATVPGGSDASASLYGQLAYASGKFSVAGDAQASQYVLRNTSTDASLTELFLDGVGQRITIASGRAVAFEILVAGRTADGDSSVHLIVGLIENTGGTTRISSKNTIWSFVDSSGVTAIAQGDDANDALTVKVTGPSVTEDMRWVANVRTAEVNW